MRKVNSWSELLRFEGVDLQHLHPAPCACSLHPLLCPQSIYLKHDCGWDQAASNFQALEVPFLVY